MSARIESLWPAAKPGVQMFLGLAIFVYALAGAAWLLWPAIMISCPPLSVDTKIIEHHTSPSAFFIGWASWPLDVREVELEAIRRGVSMGEVRREAARHSVCGL
jgi:hypothetical protein